MNKPLDVIGLPANAVVGKHDFRPKQNIATVQGLMNRAMRRLKSPVILLDHEGQHPGVIVGRSFNELMIYDVRLADGSIRTNVYERQLRECGEGI
jgi:hypothetical protein